jgi:ATP diphosphatase
MVNVVRLLGMDAEQALGRANAKFERRFREMEQGLRAQGQPEMRSLTLQQLDVAWEAVKRRERSDDD